MSQKHHFSPILDLILGFCAFSSVNIWVLPVYDKKFRKKCRVGIFYRFYAKIDWNLWEIPLFSQKSWYLKNTFSWTSFARNVLES